MFNASSGDGNTSPTMELADYSLGATLAQSTSFTGASAAPSPLKQEEKLTSPWGHTYPTATRSTPLPINSLDFAAPLDPLRDRDTSALAEFFDREDMSNVEQDLNYHLLLLFPEPCWEEADLEFLREYL